MITSTTLQSKILKTRKRLFEDTWQPRIMVISFLGVLAIESLCLRSTYIATSYGVVESEIPTMSVPVNDPDRTAYRETPRSQINEQTPVIILTSEEFYFGTLSSFTEEFTDVRNKFFVKHDHGAPDLNKLIETMTKWIFQKTSEGQYSAKGLVILLPDRNIPAPIVIQTIAHLKKSPYFSQVILAGGLM